MRSLRDPRGGITVLAPHVIGGDERSAKRLGPVFNPARADEIVGHYCDGTGDDVDLAVVAASGAFSTWSRLSFEERGSALVAAAASVLEDADNRSVTSVLESGKILGEAENEIRAGSRVLDYYGSLGRVFEAEFELPSGNGHVRVVKKPRGVVSAIVPWNAPILLAMLSVCPALLAGNTVVLKPSVEAPLALTDFATKVASLLPAGALNVVNGDVEVGRRMVTHPDVRGVSFTGSTAVGKVVAQDAAATFKRVSLELGGNDPAVVLDDVDLDGDMIDELVRGVYATSGQVCYAVKRIFVARQIFDDFVARFTDASSRIVVGDGLDPVSDIGPLINQRQLQHVRSLVAAAASGGASIREVGTKGDVEWDKGWFQLPTIVTSVGDEADIVTAEQFGPAIPIMPFDSVDEAIRRANRSSYGLASSIWTADEDRGLELALSIEAGTTFVNTHRPGSSAVDMPFGGIKESGIGRGHGVIAVEEQLELHTVSSRRP